VTVINYVSVSELIVDSWNPKTSMSQARPGLGVVAVDGKIYTIGGSSADEVIVGANECYNPETDTWITVKSMPASRSQFTIAAWQGKIYCIGGFMSVEVGVTLYFM